MIDVHEFIFDDIFFNNSFGRSGSSAVSGGGLQGCVGVGWEGGVKLAFF
jgi:hypothetical protein